jgi:DNA-binding LytR/AlgR family response regulator
MNPKVVLLVDDDFLNRRLSKKILSESGYLTMEAKNAEEALYLLKNETIHFVILDINLGEQERDGISLGQEIKDTFSIPFTYLTAYDNTEIMTKAVATIPNSYITKPFKQTDLVAAVALGINQLSRQEKRKSFIIVKDEDFSIELPIENIYYLEADKNYLLLHTQDKAYKTRCTIKQIMEQLPKSTFIQTHRAFVVNKNKIDKFSTKNLIVNNKHIPVSKNYIEDINQIYK